MFKLLNTDIKAYAFILVTASLLFIPFIGNMHLFDWDEINFAECAREMVMSHNYSDVQLYYHPFWEKPPLFIWLQAMSMNVFGINEFSARFPNALCGIITLLVLYTTGKKLNNKKFGLIWAFVYASSLLPHLFFKTGIIDPWFNLFIYGSVYYLILHTNNPVSTFGYRTAILSGLLLGLALLTKGPAALIILGLVVVVFFILGRLKKISSFKFMVAFFVAFLVTGLSWFCIEVINGHGQVIEEFINYQIRLFKTEDSDHGGSFFYHFVVLLFGCFPASLFLILAHSKSNSDTPFQKHSKRWMMSLFWVVLILFSIVQTKIVHYSSLCYFPLTYLAAYAIQHVFSGQYNWKKTFHVFCISITCLLSLVFIIIGCVPFIMPWIISSGFIEDSFAVENLKASVSWSGFEWLIGVIFAGVALLSLYKIKKGQLKFMYGLFLNSLFAVVFLILLIAPKVEQYSQNAAIEFYKQCAIHHFYVESIGFKSYGSLFYGQLNPSFKNDKSFNDYFEYRRKTDFGDRADVSHSFIRTCWMIDVPNKNTLCFVSKNTEEGIIAKNHPELKVLYRKNGFVFYLKTPQTK